MWQQKVKFGESTNNTNDPSPAKNFSQSAENAREHWYSHSEEYWRKVEPTVDGMLGGLEHVSDVVRRVTLLVDDILTART